MGNDKISINDVKSYIKRHKTILLLLIPIILSCYLRLFSVGLPATDDWAENTITTNIRSQIISNVIQQYPHLPDFQKEQIINEQLEEYISNNKQVIDDQTMLLSKQFKDRLKDENDQTYLLAIDPWTYLRYANNLERYGHIGTTLKDGKPFDEFLLAPTGLEQGSGSLHIYLIYYLHKVLSTIDDDLSMMTVSFYIPVLLIALSIIPAFFIARRKGGDLAGFIAGFVVAISPSLLTRTPAGFSDTDGYSVLFPLIITWFFLAAFDAPNIKKKILYSFLAGGCIGLFAFTWQGWWFIFDFLIGVGIVYILYLLYEYYYKHNNTIKLIKDAIIILVIFLIVGGFITTFIFPESGGIKFTYQGPYGFLAIKDVGTKSIWPNVITTVAEQNSSNLKTVVFQIGGKTLFLISLIGIGWMFFKKDLYGYFDIKYSVLLGLWFLSTTYASLIGTRFTLMLVPAFGIALGIGLSLLFNYLTNYISKEFNIGKLVVQICLIIIIFGLFIFPRNLVGESINIAYNENPSMNDAWYQSLEKIKYNSEPNAIITSWWDFGHWFKAIGDRPVTFDGGTQNTPLAHWVGKFLSTGNEKEALGILRMIDCGSKSSHDKLKELIGDDYEAVMLLTKLVKLDKQAGYIELLKHINKQDVDNIIDLIYCEPPEAFIITSADMVNKAGVWAHFGSWNFTKAEIVKNVRGKKQNNGTKYLKDKFNMSYEEANKMYYEINALQTSVDVNNYIAPWPSYATGFCQCEKINKSNYICPNNIHIDLEKGEAFLENNGQINYPKVFTYSYNGTVITKINNSNSLNIQGRELGIIFHNGNFMLADPTLVDSMFTRLFFMGGIDLDHFELFSDMTGITGGRILIWKVKWN